MKRVLRTYVTVSIATLAAVAISVFTRFNAMFVLAAAIVVAVPLWFGLPLVRHSKEELRTRTTWPARLGITVDSSSELWAFRFLRVIGWFAIGFSSLAVAGLVYSITRR